MSHVSQADKVVAWIKRHGNICFADCVYHLNILSNKRITDAKRILEGEGYEWTDEWEERTNRDGDKITYKRYSIRRGGRDTDTGDMSELRPQLGEQEACQIVVGDERGAATGGAHNGQDADTVGGNGGIDGTAFDDGGQACMFGTEDSQPVWPS